MIVYSKENYKTATSYISLLEFKNLAAGNFFLKDLEIPVDDNYNELLLETATSIFDNKFRFKSDKIRKEQRLEFPRVEFGDIIPENIKLFIVFTVFQLIEDASIYTIENNELQVKREKLDVLETEYFENKTIKNTFINKLNAYSVSLIKKYIYTNNFQVPVVRG